jgi:hypothetical protein
MAIAGRSGLVMAPRAAGASFHSGENPVTVRPDQYPVRPMVDFTPTTYR